MYTDCLNFSFTFVGGCDVWECWFLVAMDRARLHFEHLHCWWMWCLRMVVSGGYGYSLSPFPSLSWTFRCCWCMSNVCGCLRLRELLMARSVLKSWLIIQWHWSTACYLWSYLTNIERLQNWLSDYYWLSLIVRSSDCRRISLLVNLVYHAQYCNALLIHWSPGWHWSTNYTRAISQLLTCSTIDCQVARFSGDIKDKFWASFPELQHNYYSYIDVQVDVDQQTELLTGSTIDCRIARGYHSYILSGPLPNLEIRLRANPVSPPLDRVCVSSLNEVGLDELKPTVNQEI